MSEPRYTVSAAHSGTTVAVNVPLSTVERVLRYCGVNAGALIARAGELEPGAVEVLDAYRVARIV